ncbi:MAG TPA: polysaccharide biosynthesis/export family protein [Pirellulales bacterium]|nr:polysaccharide biosynthesis/export family protein [Pirellulales bacterium]
MSVTRSTFRAVHAISDDSSRQRIAAGLHNSRCLAACWGSVLLAIAQCCGCAHNEFQATKLPTKYLAPNVDNVQTVDLSKLSAPAVNSEAIDRGDVLAVTVDSSFNGTNDRRPTVTPVRVGDDGNANVPLIGRVPLAGLTLSAAEQAISTASVERGIFRDPVVTVTMQRQRMNKVTVIGAVENPGIYELPRASSALLNALVVAGGLNKDAGTEVELHRPPHLNGDSRLAHTYDGNGLTQTKADPSTVQAAYTDQPTPQTEAIAGSAADNIAGNGNPQWVAGGGGATPPVSTRIDLAQAVKQGDQSYYLNDGDVVMVYKRDPHPVHVIGLVREPGEFELPVNREMRMLDALAKAKGVSSQLADKVHVIRQMPGQTEPIVIDISLHEAKTSGKGNIRLASGDIVSVEQTPATVMYDTINNFLRFGISGSIPLF